MIDAISTWANGLGAQYGVNPVIFASIYIGAIPLFLASIAWLVRNARAGKPTVLPVMCAGACFVSAYVYLAIAGRNIPVWVWVFLAVLIRAPMCAAAAEDARNRRASFDTGSVDCRRTVPDLRKLRARSARATDSRPVWGGHRLVGDP